jgi:hypothetical protein
VGHGEGVIEAVSIQWAVGGTGEGRVLKKNHEPQTSRRRGRLKMTRCVMHGRRDCSIALKCNSSRCNITVKMHFCSHIEPLAK